MVLYYSDLLNATWIWTLTPIFIKCKLFICIQLRSSLFCICIHTFCQDSNKPDTFHCFLIYNEKAISKAWEHCCQYNHIFDSWNSYLPRNCQSLLHEFPFYIWNTKSNVFKESRTISNILTLWLPHFLSKKEKKKREKKKIPTLHCTSIFL